jgi:hypothetical protein
MGKKVIISILLVLFLGIGGCGASGGRMSPGSVDTKALKGIPDDEEIITGISGKSPAAKSTYKQDEDILELKHWKYGSERLQPVSSPTLKEPHPPREPEIPEASGLDEVSLDNWEPVSIELLSMEEIELIMKSLIELGYLEGPVNSDKDFADALRAFQKDNSLLITGKLDSQTRELLTTKK